MPVCETITLLGALSSAISGPEIVKSMVGGLIGDGAGVGVERLSQSLYSLATGAQNENTLTAMHDCFVGSMQAMAKACESAGGNAQDYFAREALGKFGDWKTFNKLPADDAERLIPLLDQQVRAIFGQQARDVRAVATDQVIAAVEQSIGCILTPALRTVFHDGRGRIGGWAFEFETRFSRKLEAKQVFNGLVMDRLNELVATTTRVEDKQDQLLALYDRKDGERFLDRWQRNQLGPDELARVEALMATSRGSGSAPSQSEIADAAVVVGALEQSNDPERREAAAEIEAGQGREGAARLAESARNVLAGHRLDAAARLREAARVVRPFSVGDALGYFREAAALDPDDFWTWVEICRLGVTVNTLTPALEAANQAMATARTPRDRAVALDERGDILVKRNDLAGAFAAYEEGLAIRRTLVGGDASSAEAQRDVSVSLNNVGDILVRRNDLAGALAAYEEGLAIARTLARGDASAAGAQRDVSVSLERVGDILVRRNDLAGALAAHEEGLAIRRTLVEGDASSAEAQRDVSVSLNKVGDILVKRNDLASALAAYEEGLAIRRTLARGDTSSAEAQRDVSVSLNKVGDVLVRRNDLAGALAAYEEGLAIARMLAKGDASSAAAQRDVYVSLNRVGDIFVKRNDLAGALAAYEEGLAITRTLASGDASSADAQRDVSISLNRVGDILVKRNDLAGALAAHQEGLAIARTLVRGDASSADAQRDVSVCLNRVGDILVKRDDLAGALAAYEEALAIARTLASGDASSADAQRDLWISLWRMADMRAPGHGWVAVKAQWDMMRARDMVAPSDEQWTVAIDRRLADEGT